MTIPHITMGPHGPQVSRLALGLWRLADWDLTNAQILDLVRGSLDLGITTFDHADIYGDYQCEQIFGRALALEPALREKMQIATKCGIKLLSPNGPAQNTKHYDTGYRHIIASVEHSLHVLGTDRIDLLLIHRPDPLMDPDQVAAAFGALRRAGKVLHFGVSNFGRSQFELLASRLDFPLVTNQIELSVLHMDALHDGTVDQCLQRGIAPMAWSPLGGGALFRSGAKRAQHVREALQTVGEELGGASLDQVALAWILRHPARIVPIVGTGKLERVRSAAGAAALELSREQWFSIWSASAGGPVP